MAAVTHFGLRQLNGFSIDCRKGTFNKIHLRLSVVRRVDRITVDGITAMCSSIYLIGWSHTARRSQLHTWMGRRLVVVALSSVASQEKRPCVDLFDSCDIYFSLSLSSV